MEIWVVVVCFDDFPICVDAFDTLEHAKEFLVNGRHFDDIEYKRYFDQNEEWLTQKTEIHLGHGKKSIRICKRRVNHEVQNG